MDKANMKIEPGIMAMLINSPRNTGMFVTVVRESIHPGRWSVVSDGVANTYRIGNEDNIISIKPGVNFAVLESRLMPIRPEKDPMHTSEADLKTYNRVVKANG